uniref:Uncharacterized protein n=1 Tax=Glossina austeni TaxID=7395 RepID=A0A1A9V6T3_GLOAU
MHLINSPRKTLGRFSTSSLITQAMFALFFCLTGDKISSVVGSNLLWRWFLGWVEGARNSGMMWSRLVLVVTTDEHIILCLFIVTIMLGLGGTSRHLPSDDANELKDWRKGLNFGIQILFDGHESRWEGQLSDLR